MRSPCTRADGRGSLADENGTVARVTIPDVDRSNGAIRMIGAVPAPRVDAAAAGPATDDVPVTGTATADEAALADAMAAGVMGGDTVVAAAAMAPTMTIVEGAVSSADCATLVAAVQAAGPAETLAGPHQRGL